jgi:hypothetical protein
MQGLKFIVSPNRDRWSLTVGQTFLGDHPSPELALRAGVDMARRTRGDSRVLLQGEDGGLEQRWPT